MILFLHSFKMVLKNRDFTSLHMNSSSEQISVFCNQDM